MAEDESLLLRKIALAADYLHLNSEPQFPKGDYEEQLSVFPIPRFGDYSVSSFHGYWHPICFSEGDSSFQISSLSNILAMVTMKKKQSLPCMQDKQICSSSTKGSGPTLSPRDFWKSLEGELQVPPGDLPVWEKRTSSPSTVDKRIEFTSISYHLQPDKKIPLPCPSFFLSQSPSFLEHLIVKVLAFWFLTWKINCLQTIYIVAIRFPGYSFHYLQTQSP